MLSALLSVSFHFVMQEVNCPCQPLLVGEDLERVHRPHTAAEKAGLTACLFCFSKTHTESALPLRGGGVRAPNPAKRGQTKSGDHGGLDGGGRSVRGAATARPAGAKRDEGRRRGREKEEDERTTTKRLLERGGGRGLEREARKLTHTRPAKRGVRKHVCEAHKRECVTWWAEGKKKEKSNSIRA